MEKTIFEKIIARGVPAFIVHEDDETIAFLDIHPTIRGHTLVVPKQKFVNMFDVPPVVLARVMATVQIVAKKLQQKLGAQGVNILNANGAVAQQSVFHLHFHVLPRFEKDGIHLWPEGEDKTPLADVYAKLR